MTRKPNSYVRPLRPCVRCQRCQTIYGRGLCQRCHHGASADGTLIDYELRNGYSRDDLLDFYVLSRSVLSMAAMAEAMGMKLGSLQRALIRARAAGDERAFTPAG